MLTSTITNLFTLTILLLLSNRTTSHPLSTPNLNLPTLPPRQSIPFQTSNLCLTYAYDGICTIASYSRYYSSGWVSALYAFTNTCELVGYNPGVAQYVDTEIGSGHAGNLLVMMESEGTDLWFEYNGVDYGHSNPGPVGGEESNCWVVDMVNEGQSDIACRRFYLC